MVGPSFLNQQEEINTASSETPPKQMDHSATESLTDRHDPATGGEKSPYENETSSSDKAEWSFWLFDCNFIGWASHPVYTLPLPGND